jgi:hypothetical protein
MPTNKRRGGGGIGSKQRTRSVEVQSQSSSSGQKIGHVGRNTLAGRTSQPKFNIAPLILEGVKVNKLQLNDILKQHLKDVKVNDIQLSPYGSFTLYASDRQFI